MSETIKMPSSLANASLKEKGSEFLAFVYPVRSEDEVTTQLQSLRKRFFDATHCCWAYSIYQGISKYSDDGEPTGTAGKRIMGAIRAVAADNLLLAVIRYYGGVNLGTGLLGKCYHDSAALALQLTSFTILKQFITADILFSFQHSGKVFSLAGRSAVRIENFMSGEIPGIHITVPPECYTQMTEELVNACRGDITILRTGEIFLP